MLQSVARYTNPPRLKIVDLTLKNADDSINLCIGSKPGFELAREEKRQWLEKRLSHGVGGKLAYSDGQLAGMVEYSPIEYAPFPVGGDSLLHINCIWVLPRFQRMTIGENLVRSCISEARTRGKRGLSVLAYGATFFMPATFFVRQGFRTVQRRGSQELMWKELQPCKPPSFLPMAFSPERDEAKVAVDVLYSAQCPWSIMTRDRIERVSREFSGAVKVRLIDTEDRRALAKFGESRKVFVNGNETFFAPPTEGDIRKVFETCTKSLERESRTRV